MWKSTAMARERGRADTVTSQAHSGAALLPTSCNRTAPTAPMHKHKADADAWSDSGTESKVTALQI